MLVLVGGELRQVITPHIVELGFMQIPQEYMSVEAKEEDTCMILIL